MQLRIFLALSSLSIVLVLLSAFLFWSPSLASLKVENLENSGAQESLEAAKNLDLDNHREEAALEGGFPLHSLFLLLAIALGFSFLLTKLLYAYLRACLLDLDPSRPPKMPLPKDLKGLSERLQSALKDLKNQLKALKRNQNQILLLAQNMTDGLIVFNKLGKILLANKQTKTYFPDIRRLRSIHDCEDGIFTQRVLFYLQSFKRGKDQKEPLRLNHRGCELLFCPVHSKGKFRGLIVMLRPEDARLEAERLRREFSGNVSHELKTPLTSILTSSQMLANGLVAKEDLGRFVAVIEEEAKRLLGMIDEIFKLSFLDEKAPISLRRLNLKELVKEVADSLKIEAIKRDVGLECRLEEGRVLGNADLLRNLIKNLCENAIRYSKRGGLVSLQLQRQSLEEGGGLLLSVQDRGLGIPKEFHERIFERFFCVDKSRSKKLGGSGLGLSIVKSVAKLHGASLRVESKEGEGSIFFVGFKEAEGEGDSKKPSPSEEGEVAC